MAELLLSLLILSFGFVGITHLGHFFKKLPAYLTGKLSQPAIRPLSKAVLLSLFLVPFLTLLMTAITLFHFSLVKAAGTLTVEIISGYNLVVDSNVESPSSYAPSVATVAGKFCNTGDAPLTNVQGNIGNYNGGVGDTPGIYPARNSSTAGFITEHPHLANTGLYSFTHVGGRIGLRDASRYIGTLAPGECRIQYWHFTYPRRANPNNSGVAVWGDSSNFNDDLWLDFDVWGTTTEGVNANATRQATMRNEISAMANKIQPNGGVWFNTNTAIVKPGDLITSNGVRYELGVINKGFDNDSNGQYDYNAWLQPIGDPSYDPSCFRLIRTSGVVTVSRSGGNPNLIIPFTDQLYFTNLPTDNNGVIGNVYYTFMALGGPCSTILTPYQEVASGADNEKFNGDYGVSIPPVQSSEPEVNIDKTGNATVTLGGTINYAVPASNDGTANAGLPLITDGGSDAPPWVPLVFSDTIPAGMIYKQGSATHTFTTTGVIILYSTDLGQTWSMTEPTVYTAVTSIQWWLTDTLRPAESGRVLFGVTVPLTYNNSYVENCADASFGAGVPFDQACTTTLVSGPNLIGDQVWRDDNGNGALDGGESGLANVTVSLYLDKNGNGTLDSGDLLAMTTTTSITGFYTFNNLPNGNFLVQVDRTDPDLPFGYSPSTNVLYAVTLNNNNYLNADFGFSPSLALDKTLLTSPVLEGHLLTYTIQVTNLKPGDGTGQPAACTYDVWAHGLVEAGSDWVNPTFAITPAGPNNTYAVGDFSGNGDVLEGNSFNFTSQIGNIVSVEAIYSLYLSGVPLATSGQIDIVQGRIYTNSTLITSTTFTNSYLNSNFAGAANQKVLTWNVTSARPTWTFADFASLSAEFYLQKTGGADGAVMNLDALGYRVTTDQQCGGSSDTINPAPLSDTFDADKLQFVSAIPAQNSVYGATSPYANTGVISWTNIGPIYAGQTKVVTVTFRALEPPNNVTTTITNTAAISGATFVTGEATNNASDAVTGTLQPTAAIGDYVWRDEDGDGIQDPGEAGIYGVVISLTANVTITLNGQSYAAGSTITTTTDANGQYLFEGLSNTGQYTVAVATSSLPVGSGTLTPTYDLATGFDPIITNNQTSFTLTPTVTGSGDDQFGADFGYQLPSQIAGTIWHDWNNNGATTPDTGEEGLSGIIVTLTDSTGTVVATTTTNASGYYSFIGGFTGTYTTTVDTNSGPLASGTWLQSFDTNGLVTPNQSSVTVVTGGYGQADYSYYQTGNSDIGDTLYTDWNGDGDQDTGEEGISGVTVWLYEDSNGDGVVDSTTDALVMTATTTITGYYLFPNLPADNFIVVVNANNLPFPVAGYQQTDDPDATFDNQGPVTTNGTTDILTVDFGYQPIGTGSIGDFVWRDNDRDGLQDSGEPGIANIIVSLYEDSDGDGVISPTIDALVMTTTTNASGLYSFSNLPAGNYLVQVDTNDPDLPQDGYGNPFVLSTANPDSVTLTTGQSYLDADFGFTAGGTIGDLVWRDDDRDGAADASEPGLGGVTIRLYNDLNGDGLLSITDTVIATTTTTLTGTYLFTSLPAGPYVVVVDTTTTLTTTFTYDLNGPLDGQAGVTLTTGQIFLGADFGLPNTNGSIGDQLWIDLNDNNTYELSEPGLTGVVITLTNSSGVAITTTTDADGFYLFPNLVSDTYTVTVHTTNLPAGVSLSFEADGTLNHQTTVTLNNGENNLDVDFGYVPDLSVSKSSTGSTVPLQPGGMITYTIVVSNPSPAPVTGATISDTIPSNTSFISGSLIIIPSTAASLVQPTGNPPLLYISPITISANSLVTITYRVAVTNPIPADVNTITNTVVMTSMAGVTGTDMVTNAVGAPAADVTIAKADNPDPIGAGGVLTYTLVYTNNGPSDANNVVITDTLPAQVTFGGVVSETPAITGPIQSGQELVWTISNLPSSASGSIVFTVTIDSAASGIITNSVVITTSTPDNNPSNNNDDEPTTVIPVSSISGEVRFDNDADGDLFDPDSGLPGVTVVLYTDPNGDGNPGDGLPILTTTTTLTGSYVFTNITPGSYVIVETDLPGYTSTADTDAPNDNQIGVILTGGTNSTGNDFLDTQPANLSLNKSVNSSTVAAGGVLTYTLVYSNNGPAIADNVTITDTLPTSVTFGGVVSETPVITGPNQNGQALVWNIPSLAPSSSGSIIFTVTVSSFVTGVITNSAVITSTTPDDDPSNNSDDVPTTVQQADVVIVKSDSPDPIAAGGILTYTLVYTNNGPAIADNITITDTLPTSVTFGSIVSETPAVTGPSQSGQVLVWSIPSLAAGASGSIVFTVTVDGTTSGLITNSVVITTSTPDSNPNNNGDDEPTEVGLPGLNITKTLVSSSPMLIGQPVQFQIVVENTGNTNLPAVSLIDSYDPTYLTYNGASPTSDDNNNDGIISWTNIGPIAVGSRVTVTVNFTATASTQTLLNDVTINQARASGTDENGTPVTPVSDTDLAGIINPDLTVNKSVNIALVAPNQIVTYTITITNSGDVTINPVRVTDTLEAGLTFVPGTANPAPSVINGQQLVWNDVTGGTGLPPGASTQITLLTEVTTTIGIYGNSVIVDGDHPIGTITPPVTDTVSTIVEDPSVEVDKQVSAPGLVGELITFTIRITNTGPSILDQIPLFDSFTGPIEYVGGIPQADTVDPVNRRLTWNDLTTFFGDLAPGQAITIITVFRLTTTATEFSMVNTARVDNASDVLDNEANDDEDTEVLTNIPTAVDLLYFTSQRSGDNVELHWATAVEYDNYGFRLLRSTTGNFADAVELGFIPGQGQGTASGTTYTFLDEVVEIGQTYTYWLVDVDFNGTETAHSETTSISINAGGGGATLYLPLIFK